MEKNRKKTKSIRSLLIQRTAFASFQYQNCNFARPYLFLLLSIVQLLGIICIIPQLLDTVEQKVDVMTVVLQYLKRFDAFIESDQNNANMQIQIVHSIYLLITLGLILFAKSSIVKIGFQLCTVYYSLSVFLAPLTVNSLFMVQVKGIVLFLIIINIILGIFACLLFNMIRSSYSCKHQNFFLVLPNRLMVFQQMATRILLIFLPWLQQNNSRSVSIGYLSVFLLLALLEGYNLINYFVTFKSFSATILKISCCLKLSILFITFMLLAFEEELISVNFFQVTGSTFFCSFFTLQRYLNYIHQQIEIKDPETIITQQEALLYIYTIVKTYLKDDDGSYEKAELISTTFRYKHIQECDKTECYCKQAMAPNMFEDKAIQQKLWVIQKNFQRNSQIVNFIHIIYLQCFEVFAESLSKLVKLKKKQKDDWNVQLLVSKFNFKIGQFLKRKNRGKQIANTEKYFEMDVLNYRIRELINNSIKLKTDFWSQITKTINQRQFFDRNIEEQLIIIKQMNIIVKLVAADYNNNQIFLSLLTTYYKFIELKTRIPIILRHLISDSTSIKKQSNSQNRKNSNGRDIASMSNKQCCVIQTQMQVGNMGIILNSSDNVQQIFGFDKNVVKGLNINKLMPVSMHKQHDRLLAHWLQTGSWNNIGIIRYVFAFTNREICFECGIYIKIIQREEQMSLIACFFKKNTQDYMLVNSEGIIDGAGYNFINLLGEKIVGISLKEICHDSQKILRSSNIHKINTSSFMVIKNSQKKIFKHFQLTRNEAMKMQDSYLINYEIRKYHMGQLSYTLLKFVSSKENLTTMECQDSEAHKKDETTLKDNGSLEVSSNPVQCDISSINSSFVKNGDRATEHLFENIDKYHLNPSIMKQRRVKILIFTLLLLILIGFSGLIASIFLKNIYEQAFNQASFIIINQKVKVHSLQLLSGKLNNIEMQTLINDQQTRTILKFQLLQIKQLVFNKSNYSTPDQQIVSVQEMRRSLNKLVDWHTSTNQVIEIYTSQFYINYVYLIEQIILQRQLEKKKIFQNNFDTLKTIEDNILSQFNLLYQTMIEDKNIKMISIRVMIMVISILIIVISLMHVSFRQDQTKKLIQIVGLIDKGNVGKLITYYETMANKIKSIKDVDPNKDSFPDVYDFNQNLISLQFEQKRQGINRIKLNDHYSFKRTIALLLLVLGNLLMQSINIVFDFNSSQLIFEISIELNQMLESEDTIMETYQGLKLLQKNEIVEKQSHSYNYMIQKMDQTIVEFNRILFVISNKFYKNNLDFQNFQPLLLTDCCQIIQSNFAQTLGEKCKTEPFYPILKNGLIMSFNQIHRNLYRSITKNKRGEYDEDQYKQLGSYLYYIGKVSNHIESQIMNRFILISHNHEKIYITKVALSSTFFFFNIVLLVIGYFYDRNKVQKSMGQASIIPLSLIKATKYMVQQIIKILQV